MPATREIEPENWGEYFDSLSKELLNAPVSIEIVAPSDPPTTEARNLALLTLAYDRRRDVFEVAAGRGGPHLPTTLRHLVDHPEHVYVDSPAMLAPLTIAVDGRDGVRTVIRIEDQPDFAG
jgi:Family of unknown function (DUF5335)